MWKNEVSNIHSLREDCQPTENKIGHLIKKQEMKQIDKHIDRQTEIQTDRDEVMSPILTCYTFTDYITWSYQLSCLKVDQELCPLQCGQKFLPCENARVQFRRESWESNQRFRRRNRHPRDLNKIKLHSRKNIIRIKSTLLLPNVKCESERGAPKIIQKKYTTMLNEFDLKTQNGSW